MCLEASQSSFIGKVSNFPHLDDYQFIVQITSTVVSKPCVQHVCSYMFAFSPSPSFVLDELHAIFTSKFLNTFCMPSCVVSHTHTLPFQLPIFQ